MKSIVAKPDHQTAQICSAAKIRKRASRDADGELAHLEQVVSAVRASTEIELPIGAAYWLARIHDLRVRYELLPVQLARLSAIEHCVRTMNKTNGDPCRSAGPASPSSGLTISSASGLRLRTVGCTSFDGGTCCSTTSSTGRVFAPDWRQQRKVCQAAELWQAHARVRGLGACAATSPS